MKRICHEKSPPPAFLLLPLLKGDMSTPHKETEEENSSSSSSSSSSSDEQDQNNNEGQSSRAQPFISQVGVARPLDELEPDDAGLDAWCIVMCVFTVNIVVMGFLKCMGILILEIKRAYKASPSDISVLVSICTCLNSAAGPLACYLMLKFSVRSVAFVGTTCVCLGLMLSWFADNIIILYFTIGVLVGLGSGLTYTPGVILVGNHFQYSRRRGMANGVVVSGSPVGGMVMPYIINALTHHLGCRGALLVMGVLMVNAVVCTLSYKPYTRKRERLQLSNSDTKPFYARRTAASIHIPSSSRSCISCPNYVGYSDSEESGGPEFIEDEPSSAGANTDAAKREVATDVSGSVIVYKVNERYGQQYKRRRRDSKPSITLSRPPLWPKTASDNMSGGAGAQMPIIVDVQSKASQTEIPGRKDGGEGHFHSLKRATGSESCRVKTVPPPTTTLNTRSFPAIEANAVVGTLPKILGREPDNRPKNPDEPQPVKLDSRDIPETQIPTTARNDVYLRKGARPSSTHPVSTRNLPPYILSLDHSCVIMWSNDNLLKGQQIQENRKHSVTQVYEGRGDQDVCESSAQLSENATETDNKAEEIQPVHAKKKPKCCCSRLLSWLKKSPLRNPTYLILLFSDASTAISTTNILLLIPQFGEHKGLTKTEASTVYLIFSLSDLCFRLFGSFLYDRKYLSPQTVFTAGLLAAGVSSFLIGIADDFPKFCIFSCLFGLSCGLHIGVFGTLLAEVVGVAQLPVGYAFVMILNGILQFTFINVSGKILSSNPEAYTMLYSFYGICLLIGGSLWFWPMMVEKYHCVRRWNVSRRIRS